MQNIDILAILCSKAGMLEYFSVRNQKDMFYLNFKHVRPAIQCGLATNIRYETSSTSNIIRLMTKALMSYMCMRRMVGVLVNLYQHLTNQVMYRISI